MILRHHQRKAIQAWCAFAAFVTVVLFLVNRDDRENETAHHQLMDSRPFRVTSSSRAQAAYTNYTIYRLGLQPLDLPALDPDMGPVINDVMSFKYPIDLYPPKCLKWAEGTGKSLMVVVVSAPGNFKRRHHVRRTLAAKFKGEADRDLIFLIGTTARNATAVAARVANESLEHGDMVQVDLIDSYANLTLKSVALLHWVHTHCPGAAFALKSDDDNFVNVKVLNEVLTAGSFGDKSISGLEVPTKLPTRTKGHKHYLSRKIWPWNLYPFYLMGGAYMVSRKAVRPLLAAAQTTPFFPFEDVYISGLCAFKANVTLLTPDRLYDQEFTEGTRLSSCFIRNTAIWQTRSIQQYLRSERMTHKIYSHYNNNNNKQINSLN